MANIEHREWVGLVRDAVITLAVVVLAVLALDDIPTDSAQSFLLERSALAVCAVWFYVVAWRLWRRGHRVLGALSAGFVTIGALAQPAIGPGTAPMQLGYFATVGAVAWFFLLSGRLAVSAWRPRHSRAA